MALSMNDPNKIKQAFAPAAPKAPLGMISNGAKSAISGAIAGANPVPKAPIGNFKANLAAGGGHVGSPLVSSQAILGGGIAGNMMGKKPVPTAPLGVGAAINPNPGMGAAMKMNPAPTAPLPTTMPATTGAPLGTGAGVYGPPAHLGSTPNTNMGGAYTTAVGNPNTPPGYTTAIGNPNAPVNYSPAVGNPNAPVNYTPYSGKPVYGPPTPGGTQAGAMQKAPTDIFTPGSYGGYDPTAQEQAYFDQQLAGYQGQQEAARMAMQQGLSANDAYLQEQLRGLQGQQAVDSDAAQQLQNRRGGFYSGGLDYQLGGIESSYANQRGGLARDIGARNQSLIDQYGNQANTIAQQINELTQRQPDILRNRIADWINNERGYGLDYAGTFGGLNGMKTSAQQQQDFNQMDTNRKFNVDTAFGLTDRSGKMVAPQTDTRGLWRQLNTGETSIGTPLEQSMTGQQTQSGLVTDQQQRDLATRDTALQEWQQAGYATPNVAAALGIPVGTPTNDASYRQIQNQLDQDKFTYSQWQDAAQAQGQGQQANGKSGINQTAAREMISNTLSPYTAILNSEDSTPEQKQQAMTEMAQTKEQIFVDMYNNYGMTGTEMTNMLMNSGYTSSEIQQLKKEYPSVFQ